MRHECNKNKEDDPCYNVNCGVGTCSGGTCSCPDGYSGSNCQNSCPTGYDWLSSSNTCVKFYSGDYRSWAELKLACQNDGADLPLLNTDTLFNDFRIYMDQKSSDRVAVDATLSGNQGIWSNGDVLSSNRFCSGIPICRISQMSVYILRIQLQVIVEQLTIELTILIVLRLH
ncbi:unnamed protein product [Mytilus edulis]|uniref:Uncharacterized protein n=1 Tax=Mytilus edulis TaxID=6550 RepID=A0A8S3R3Q7_MYTED|nr:unnamed protein product [Mytilus edulis]